MHQDHDAAFIISPDVDDSVFLMIGNYVFLLM